LIQRFASQDRRAFDHWHKEELSQLTVPNTPENLARIHKIFAFQSSFMQNIVAFTPGNFHIRVLAQPFTANCPDALLGLTPGEAEDILRQFLAFLNAAREWEMDFLDFSRFQLLPGPMLRFAWRLETQDFPSPAAWIRLFNKNRHLRDLDEDNYLEFLQQARKKAVLPEFPVYLCRNGDFASSLLHAHSPGCAKAGANVRIRINTKFPWQKKVIRNNLFQNLNGGETLLLKLDLESVRLGDYFSGLCGQEKSSGENLAAQAQEFRFFQKKSVFQEIVLLIDNLAKKEDDRLLRFLLESGDVSGLTVVLFNDSAPGDCDLEFNEDPHDPLARHFAGLFPGPGLPELDGKEIGLLKKFAWLEVPVPKAVARLLASHGDSATELPPASQGDGATELTPAPQGDGATELTPTGRDADARLASLLKKRCLLESKDRQTLGLAIPGDKDPGSAQRRSELLAWLAANSDWAYARVAHFIASGQPAALERYLGKQALESPAQVAPGPAADLLCRYLSQTTRGGKILEYFVDILIQSNCPDLAGKVLAAGAGAGSVLARLKAAHLAMRRKDYRRLGELLAGMPRVAPGLRDEWLYLNFVYHEKIGQGRKAGEYIKKIVSPYYRNLAIIQWSDRGIYNRGFAKARSQLAGALEYFSSRHRDREEIETLSQMAKLHREMGDFQEAESLYKTIFIRSESDGLALNSAYAAVDLGNLYFENDDDFQAECWYRKAAGSFARENNQDGIMLVNSNLLNILHAKGGWLEADRLLSAILAWDEEKRLLNSCAIDYLNGANLEVLRLRDDQALKLVEQAAEIFKNTANSKGLTECAFVRGRISFFAETSAAAAMPGCPWFNDDQKIVCTLFGPSVRGADSLKEPALFKMLDGIRSKKVKFEALRLLLKKYRKSEWLDRFQEIARELAPRAKNYFYYEFWYMFFDLGADDLPLERREEFLAMHDFFTVNRRSVSAKLDRLRRLCDERARDRAFFDDARLVGNSRQWRLPEDFFSSFSHELGMPAPIDWLVMTVHEEQRQLFRFANSDLFRELGEEMLRSTLETPENQNHDLPGIKRIFRSQERFFYPFANTKMIRWQISEQLLACLVIGFRDGDSYFQDFSERHRETFKKFSVLFQNFLQNEFRIHEKLDFIVGESEKIKEMKRLIAQVSKVDFSLLITGESGSGKELVARAVHLLSPRAGQPFISVNAAAIPETLLEAELFGYRKGAFSGAGDNRVGLLEAADRGTLFLDEIADLPLPLQAKLLRALQEKEIRRLGENKTIKIDVRLVSASNKDLNELIRSHLFRADLFYRLQDLVIHIPPLRERREDVPLLIGHFLEKFAYPAQEPAKLRAIADTFRNEGFPGNVRELESKIKKMITFDPELAACAKPERDAFSLKSARQDFERNLVLNTLNEQNWRKSQTAEKLGISRMALFNLLKKYKIAR
jgi:transcriptional regulator with AAA-type ATPase domain